MNALTIDTAAIAPAWKTFQASVPVKIGTIPNEREFKRVVKFMNGLLDVVGDDESHELAVCWMWWGSSWRSMKTPTMRYRRPKPKTSCVF